MKIAILANEKDSFVLPLAQRLARMCAGCDAEAEVHYDRLETLSLPRTFKEAHPQLHRGNRAALADFPAKVGSGEIHSRLHLEHASVGR